MAVPVLSWGLTVAAIVQREDRFLVVEELDGANPQRVLNQPAGHVDPGESLIDAVIRETREETSLPFTPETLVGVYQVRARNGRDYCRVCFAGTVPPDLEARPGDSEILACHWLTREEIAARRQRSSLVLACLDDFIRGRRIPLGAIGGLRSDR
ncbi:MAG: NUDIX hydrolase [Acidobacteria bacterium]|nr:NUDIX hydrolase [Acidobacteriota bacterium]